MTIFLTVLLIPCIVFNFWYWVIRKSDVFFLENYLFLLVLSLIPLVSHILLAGYIGIETRELINKHKTK